MIGLIFENLTVILGLIGAGIVAVWGIKQRRAGRQDTKDEANAETLERVEKGRRAVDRDGQPDERLRRNDGAWD